MHSDSTTLLRFRWQKAADLLERAEALVDDARLRVWISKQRAFVAAGQRDSAALAQADQLLALAQEAGAEDGAGASYRRGLALVQAVQDAAGPFAPLAAERLGIARQGYGRWLVDRARQAISSAKPAWPEVRSLLEEALGLEGGGVWEPAARDLVAVVELNQEAERRYAQAVGVVQARTLARYPEAAKLLEGIDPRARIYPDAQAYLQWIDADLKVREAKRAYDQGDGPQAFALLAQALAHEVLGPEARTSVLQRRSQWVRVIRAYERGMEFVAAGDLDAARVELEQVLVLEPNPDNRYHQRAKAQREHHHTLESPPVVRQLEDGLKALGDRDWSGALKCFDQVRDHPAHTEDQLEQIRRAVDEANRTQRLLEGALADLAAERRERFLQVRDVSKLLVLWLPEGEPDRAGAQQVLDTIMARLKAWKESWRGD